MELGDKLRELNMTDDEIKRLSKAFKDDKFREMLHDYAQEISDPGNRKKYEEEIRLWEQERGFSAEFIQPTPFMVIRTSVAGEQKCFINICSNENIGKPTSKFDVSENGQRGQRWSLPYITHPGRQDTNPKGIKFMIYDVIFHPDTLHIASKSKAFMNMVTDTAIQGIQDGFKVTLDKNNVKEMKTKYKGVLQSCMIRKPIPGYEAKEPADHHDPLAFLHSDDATAQKKPVESPLSRSSDVNPISFQIQPQQAKEPTKPNYTVKYRSCIDLQDFRCSRDSAKGPRPKEIVVTIDLPLLKSVRDTNLEVKEKSLLLESKRPAYRLELPLSYPVDEEKGEAKFNKLRGQLTVTLPIRPLHVAFDSFVGPAASESDSKSDGESQEERSGFEEEDTCKEGGRMKREKVEQTGLEMNRAEESHMEKQETRAEKGEEVEESHKEKVEQSQKGEEKEKTGGEQEKKDRQRKEKGIGLKVQKSDRIPKNEVNTNAEKFKKQVGTDVALQNPVSSEVSFNPAASARAQKYKVCISEGGVKPRRMPEADPCSAELTSDSDKNVGKEELDEDDLQTKQIFQTTGHDKKPPTALLREIDADGTETVISDHSTSAGFNFQNKMMYELD
ncbi:protein kintoun [Cololabis saira]|uniref:protein kintoun n=1 Tax=Cololabis saira TaxID=129043 RepID=UPI002AD21DED|nr:protein kintoun [Cololabis saira]